MENKEWKKEITFTKGERSALYVIIFLIIISYIFSFWYRPQIKLDNKTYKLEELLTEVPPSDVQKYKDKANNWRYPKPKSKQKRLYPKPIYEPFNPNTIDSSKWIKLGVKPWTIKSIMKYKSKGGQFKKCSDLNKIYNMEDTTKSNLIPHCTIPIKVKKEKREFKIKSQPRPKTKTKAKKKILKAFDPNTIDSLQWLELGVQPWTIKSIMKYKSKGGTFRTCDDLRSIYNMDEALKDELYPYCSIKLEIIDLNKADTTLLKKLKGVGSVLAKSIIEYRDRLGGYLHQDQLLESWGVDQELLTSIEAQIIVKGEIVTLNINGDADPIYAHPYIESKVAKVIINYRKQHGDFKNISDIKKVRVISETDYSRLEPYLSLN